MTKLLGVSASEVWSLPSATMLKIVLTLGATETSRPTSRYPCAPGAALSVGALFGLISFGMRSACAGVTCVPGEGRFASGVDVRIVIQPSPAFLGRTKLPVKVAPAAMETTSPACALSSAAWRSCPAPTDIVFPVGAIGVVSSVTGSAGFWSRPRRSDIAWAAPAETSSTEIADEIATIRGRRPRAISNSDESLDRADRDWGRGCGMGCLKQDHSAQAG